MLRSALFHSGCEGLGNEARKKERTRKNQQKKERKKTRREDSCDCYLLNDRVVYIRYYEFLVCDLGHSKYMGHVQ
jgi:hypothetical protein